MTRLFGHLCRDEDGAVTVDWVVLTAAIVGLGVTLAAMVVAGTQGTGDEIGAYLSTVTVGSPS
ncbi:hypothetical protein OG2516_07537 [Oceanicola granulosus HTCC2516]|uniref:Flp pilus assembly protein, pilin Flp n=1 Tax=Oceanicola granulosus (strain ATCC BAA-861 / DSM 15982 / KCTC 12143 / HTCC2516) TaxID=314256 RepID=Q2CIE7_OCEGH|nr:hypothetical protein [Oceanicola granulosus]EAR52311.1 hypothetical protein OG2516_07537 [Oceanicola granulosus HTCC2516]